MNKPKHYSAASGQRQIQIEGCLLDNMQQLPYNLISVTDLCKQLGLSRRGFYFHYPDKDSCLIALIDRKIQESMLAITDMFGEKVDAKQLCVAYFRYWKEQGEFLSTIVFQNMTALFRERELRFYSEEDIFLYQILSVPGMDADIEILSAFVDLRSGMVTRWCARNFDTPVEEIGRKYYRLISSPMISKDTLLL